MKKLIVAAMLLTLSHCCIIAKDSDPVAVL